MILGKLYLGLELNRDYAMISTCVDDTLGPETVSPVAGSENYRIPVALAMKKNILLFVQNMERMRFPMRGTGRLCWLMICISAR